MEFRMADEQVPKSRAMPMQAAATPAGRKATEGLETEPSGAAERLRHKIDSGQTGDKVGNPDPAMAPLGTDDEAAQGHDEEGLRVARQAASRPPGPKGPPSR
jgi:hypothetical protein